MKSHQTTIKELYVHKNDGIVSENRRATVASDTISRKQRRKDIKAKR